MTSGAAGMDLFAAIASPIVLRPRDRVQVPCGFKIELPPGTQAEIRPRSGWALKYGVTVANSPGTIDSDYRGEVSVLLHHTGDQVLVINPQDRVAQMVVGPYLQVELEEAHGLNETQRGGAGWGSTGGVP